MGTSNSVCQIHGIIVNDVDKTIHKGCYLDEYIKELREKWFYNFHLFGHCTNLELFKKTLLDIR